jgi:PPOX class probable F420-dependent enzyme
MELSRALELLRSDRRGVLVTQRSDGRPQLSNIVYAVDDDGVVRISVTDGRAKTTNLRRTPLASLYLSRDDFGAYVVIDADVTLSAVATAADDAAVDELVATYRSLAGEHPDWDEYRQAMVTDRRLIVRLHPTRAYGMWVDD